MAEISAGMSAEMRVTRERLERKAAHQARRLRIATAATTGLGILEVVAFGIFAAGAHDPVRRFGAIVTSVGMLLLVYEI